MSRFLPSSRPLGRLVRRAALAFPIALGLASCTFPDFRVSGASSRGGMSAAGSGGGNEGGAGTQPSGGGGAGSGGRDPCLMADACASAGEPADGGGGAGTVMVDDIPGLRLLYSFEDTSTTLEDGSGNDHTGHPGSFDWVAGRDGNALELDGRFGYLNLPVTGITDGLNDFSVTLWVKPRSLANWMRLFDFGTSTDAYLTVVAMASTTGRPRFALKNPGVASQNLESSIALELDTWQLVSVTQAGNTVTLYIGGDVAASSAMITARASAFSATRTYLVRSQFADPLFDGAFDDFRLYGRALTAGEVQAISSGTAITKGLLLGYDFNETDGDLAADLLHDVEKQAKVQSGITFGPGKLGSALELDGASGYVRLPEDAMDGIGDFTVACFLSQIALANSARIFDFGTDGNDYITLMPNANSTQLLRFGARFGGGVEQFLDTVPLAVGAWNHVAVTRAGASIIVYVDGDQVGSRVLQGLPDDLAGVSNWLGRSHRGDPMLRSALDDFRSYERALSAAEIAALARRP